MIRVCSLMWGGAYDRYGRKFIETFEEYWPLDVELVIVADRELPSKRGKLISLNRVDGYLKFLNRWGADAAARGYGPQKDRKRDANGYSWRYDAVKWMPQALAPVASLEGMQDGDIFVWLDADVQTKSSVPAGWVGGLLAGADVACLQRTGTHSEIGFYAMRLGPGTRRVLERFANFYRGDGVFRLNEWHSAFVWDAALATEPELEVRNLSPRGSGHVWPYTALAAHTEHLKGKRKDQ